jgi:hypothetical protein
MNNELWLAEQKEDGGTVSSVTGSEYSIGSGWGYWGESTYGCIFATEREAKTALKMRLSKMVVNIQAAMADL